MAQKSTVFKVGLSIADMNRQYYGDHTLTLARHPSETDLRMLVRIVAFALNAHERLQFTKGMSDVDEPDLWQLSLTGDVEHWLDLGQPLEKRIRQSCSKAERVSIYAYQCGAAAWYAGIEAEVARFGHLRVRQLKIADETAVEALVARSMRLTCVIEDEQVLLTDEEGRSLAIEVVTLKP